MPIDTQVDRKHRRATNGIK